MAVRTYLKATLSISVLLLTVVRTTAAGEAIHLNATNRLYASNLYPPDDEIIEGAEHSGNIYTWLDFVPGVEANSHEAFFSDNQADVHARDPNVSLGAPPYSTMPHRYYVGLPMAPPANDTLVRGTTYYWCVDETDAYGMEFRGFVWNFSILSDKGWDPDPCDGRKFVSIRPLLSWKAGINAKWHVIYFGTNFDNVKNDIVQPLVPPPLSYRGYQPVGDEDWDPIVDGGLTIEFKTTYYWRIDEGQEELPPPIGGGIVIKGDVWSFTTRPPGLFVDTDAAGASNGSSWADAYNHLQDALAEAAGSDEIYVAEGTYKPDLGGGQTLGDRSATFQLINGVTLKGGYAGFGQPDPNARDIELYETILSGDLDGNDVDVADPCDLLNEPTRAENSYHVVTGKDRDQTAVLDGFTITAGNAKHPSDWLKRHGAGILIISGSPAIHNCKITCNSSEWAGGGMSSMFIDNPRLTNCIFVNNSAHSGGGMYNECLSSPTVTNCTFSGNSSDHRGGGIYCGDACPPGSSPFLPVITNCILYENTPDGLYVEDRWPPVVSFSDVQGGWPGLGNIDADPCFANASNGDYHLKSQAGRWDANSESWVVDDVTSPCIDAGNPGCSVGDEPAPNGNRINMGAYGVTAEASKSPIYWRSIADLTNDWVVDNNDLKVFVGYWLEAGEFIPSDLNRSLSVDFNDFAIFGLEWMKKGPGPGITYEVDKCIPWDFGSFVTAEPNQTRFSVRVEGNNIYFEDLITANCCAGIELRMTVEDNLITIYEIEHLIGVCPCICDYPVTATLGPFEEGTYLVEVIGINGISLGFVEVTIAGPGITYKIEDCNQRASGLSAAIESNQTRFSVIVDGDYIHFKDLMPANCCPDKLELQMTIVENLITIYETEHTSEGCRCMCAFPVTATLGPFEPGIYVLEVYQEGIFIGSTAVTIEPGK